MEDYETTFEEFWKDLVTNPDGSLNIDQVKRELHDYNCMLDEVPKVFCHVTGGLISKPNTKADFVIEEFENYVDKLLKEEVEDALEVARLDIIDNVFDWIEENLVGELITNADLLRKTYLEMLKKD
jgi:F0F1-type ATP synthase delta subunit